MNTDCIYCEKAEKLNGIMLPVCEIDGYPLYLYRNQLYRGRVVLAFDKHVHAISDMTDLECQEFFLAVKKVVSILNNAFHPDQVNIGMYADKMCHLHCHIVPKYENGPDWGGSFQMNSNPPSLLSEEEYEDLITTIRTFAKK